MNTYEYLRKIAKSIRFQNLFMASKELNHIKLFRNETDLSEVQEHFLALLYHYDTINQDIITHKLNKKILENDCFCECYMMWKNKKGYQQVDTQNTREVSLVAGNKLIFPKKV